MVATGLKHCRPAVPLLGNIVRVHIGIKNVSSNVSTARLSTIHSQGYTRSLQVLMHRVMTSSTLIFCSLLCVTLANESSLCPLQLGIRMYLLGKFGRAPVSSRLLTFSRALNEKLTETSTEYLNIWKNDDTLYGSWPYGTLMEYSRSGGWNLIIRIIVAHSRVFLSWSLVSESLLHKDLATSSTGRSNGAKVTILWSLTFSSLLAGSLQKPSRVNKKRVYRKDNCSMFFSRHSAASECLAWIIHSVVVSVCSICPCNSTPGSLVSMEGLQDVCWHWQMQLQWYSGAEDNAGNFDWIIDETSPGVFHPSPFLPWRYFDLCQYCMSHVVLSSMNSHDTSRLCTLAFFPEL